MQKNRLVSVVLVVGAVAIVAFLSLYFGPAARDARADDAAKAVLNEFASKLKNVPLMGESAAVTEAIETNYAPYITADLLADWKANHAHAPGRLTSSPWPERLAISSITPQGAGRLITGEVILITSAEAPGESADTVPFVAQLIPTDDGWKIAAYQEEKVQTLKNIPKTDEDIPGAR